MRLPAQSAIALGSLLTFDRAAGIHISDFFGRISATDRRQLHCRHTFLHGCLAPSDIGTSARNSTEITINHAELQPDIIIDKPETPSELGSLLDIDSTDARYSYSKIAGDAPSSDPEIGSMVEKYRGRLVYCSVPQFPNCDILLCGTLHVAKTSADMVEDTIKVLKPGFIVLELCEARLENLVEEARNVTFFDVVRESFKERSIKVFGMGLLTWMQLKSAKALGSTLGEEQTVAAKVGAHLGSTVILGDRLYGVTFQRVFDKLKFFEKLKFAIVLVWEVLTMSFLKLKDYIKKSENQEGFIQDEIARFGKYLPALAKVLIEERDEYLAKTIHDIAREVGHSRNSVIGMKRSRIMAVVGAGHLAGIQRCLAAGGVSDERMAEISSSSKHPLPGTWSKGLYQQVDPKIFLPQPQATVQTQDTLPAIDTQTNTDTDLLQPARSADISSELDSSFDQHPSEVSVSMGVEDLEDGFDELEGDIALESDALQTGDIDNNSGAETAEPLSEVAEGEGIVEESEEVVEHVDHIVSLLGSLTQVVERAHASVSAANAAAAASGVELSSDLRTHLSLLSVAVEDAKKAFALTDAAEKRAAGAEEMERELYGLSNAVVRADVAANAVIRAAEQITSGHL